MIVYRLLIVCIIINLMILNGVAIPVDNWLRPIAICTGIIAWLIIVVVGVDHTHAKDESE